MIQPAPESTPGSTSYNVHGQRSGSFGASPCTVSQRFGCLLAGGFVEVGEVGFEVAMEGSEVVGEFDAGVDDAAAPAGA